MLNLACMGKLWRGKILVNDGDSPKFSSPILLNTVNLLKTCHQIHQNIPCAICFVNSNFQNLSLQKFLMYSTWLKEITIIIM